MSSSNLVGTAGMGPDIATSLDAEDDTSSAVLDSRLRVRGVQSLMVADASAIPLVPNGNIHATVLAVADIAADFILGVR